MISKKFSKNILGLFLVGASIFLSIALASFSPNDPSFNRALDVKEIHNYAGYLGAYIAAPIVQGFGLGFLLPLFFLYTLAIKMISGKKLPYFAIKGSVLFIATPLFASVMSVLDQVFGTGYLFGGLIGKFVFNEFKVLFDGNNLLISIVMVLSLVVSVLSLNLTLAELRKISISIISAVLYGLAVIFWVMKFVYLILKRLVNRKLFKKTEDSSIYEEMPKPKQIVEIVAKPKVSEKKPQIQAKFKLEPDDFELPATNLLKEVPEQNKKTQQSETALSQNSVLLNKVLEDFGIQGEINKIHPGPVVTLYEFEPEAGVKSSRVIGLADDIARSMSAVSARIAVIPGQSALGIELPNAHRELVALREMMDSVAYQSSEDKLPLVLGKNIAGTPVIADLAKMPHLLVAGTTGSGKSVAINTMILSLLYKHSPKTCKFIMIDPKMLELSIYDGIPHLLAPVVTEPKKAVSALKWVVKEMESRYRNMSLMGVRNLDGYNKAIQEALRSGKQLEKQIQVGFDSATGQPKFETIKLDTEEMPYIVVIVDEMADLMLVAGKDIETSIQRLAQMARAAGIHIIMATQRPSVDVITGVIKANFPTRISFQVTSKIDSRTILGEQGAEQLLGMGDMLFMRGGGRIERVHGPFVSDGEVERITSFLKAQGAPKYIENITVDESGSDGDLDGMISGGDDLYNQAVAIVTRERKASTSYIQRCLRIGYNRAATIMEQMEKEGVVSSPNHVGKRDVLVGGD